MSDRRFRQAMERARYDHHVSDSYEMAIQDRVLMADRIQELKATIERVRVPIETMAKQFNTKELGEKGMDGRDYETAYDTMVGVARIAKAALEREDERG